MSIEPPSARPFQVRHPQEVVAEVSGTQLVSPLARERSIRAIAPTANDDSSVCIRSKKHNLFLPFIKKANATGTDPVGTPETPGPPLCQNSPASKGRLFVFGSAEGMLQQNNSDHETNPDERQLFDHKGFVVEGTSSLSWNLGHTDRHSRKEKGKMVGYSEIPNRNIDASNLPHTASDYYNVDDDQKALTPASVAPPEDQSLASKVNTMRFHGAGLAEMTAERRQAHTPAKRGRPRKPQLPRPGDDDFIGPLNRRGRKTTGDFVPKSGGTADTARTTNNRNLLQPGESDTAHTDKKRKHGSSGGSRDVYPSGPSFAAIPILVQLVGGDEAPRKLQIRYRDPGLRKRSPGHNAHCMLEVDCEGMSRRRANALIALFDELVYPFIQSLTNQYRGFQADEDLQTMGLDVSCPIRP